MKKYLFLIAIVSLSVQSFGSYRTKVCALRGTTDTTAVTLQERVDYCIKENSAKLLKGDIIKSSLINNTQFADAQLTEFSLRGVRGAMTQLMTPGFTADATISTAGNNATDAQLDTALVYIIWYFAKLIGMGSL